MGQEQATRMTEQELTLVGLTEDGKRLVMVSDSGEQFTVPADARLRAALRSGDTRLGTTDQQLEIQMESALRPRDIQARIRAGESPESVATAARTTLEKVMGYATPVLAERAHIADRAQRASVRRRAGEGPSRLLGDAVAERLRSRNVDPHTVEWDAWRREDGRWTLVADYRSGESPRHAEFVFDAPGRYVVAEDDEARWLVGERSASKGPQPRTAGAPGRRLSAVGADEELPLGEDAIDLVSEPDAEEPTEDLSGTVAALREQQAGEPVRGTGDADWMATQASDRLRPAARPAAETEPDAEPGEEPGSAEVAEPAPPGEGSAEPSAGDSAGDARAADEPAGPPSRRQVKKSRGRASVPSWDEIMFGGERRE
jgi:hypothetical protein